MTKLEMAAIAKMYDGTALVIDAGAAMFNVGDALIYLQHHEDDGSVNAFRFGERYPESRTASDPVLLMATIEDLVKQHA